MDRIFLARRLRDLLTVAGVTFIVAGSATAPSPSEKAVYNVGYGYYNSYLIVEDGQLMLIDCGRAAKISRLEKNIRKAGFDRHKLVIWSLRTCTLTTPGRRLGFKKSTVLKLLYTVTKSTWPNRVLLTRSGLSLLKSYWASWRTVKWTRNFRPSSRIYWLPTA